MHAFLSINRLKRGRRDAAALFCAARAVLSAIAACAARHTRAAFAALARLSPAALTLSALMLAAGLPGYAEAPRFEVPPPPPGDARAIALIDFAKGDLLFSLNPDEAIPPASLAKLMTMHVALKAVDEGRVGLYDLIPILREDTALPYGSSLMYLQPGMKVPFDDLLRGMAVISGNDAALAVARVLAGSGEAFAGLMNEEARAMGLGMTSFVEPSGLSEFNTTSAREMALFTRAYMLRHPKAIEAYHARTTMEFPRAEVMPPGVPPPPIKILLRNRNSLLFSYAGCDGLKTGFIEESGFNLIASAEREGTRFILVTLGGSHSASSRQRAATVMLNWAFANWKTVRPPMPELPSVRLWGGAQGRLSLETAESPEFTVPVGLARDIAYRVELPDELEAPIMKGAAVGRIVYTSGERVLRRIDIVAAEDGELGSLLIRLRDAIARFFQRLFTPRN
jgi:D-alanyl-D-alanine carboxypeptidase (penicillin-binding protein 5/6)